MNDLISRQAAIDALTHKWDGMVTSVFDVINSLPPALPDFDEWCTDCKEYDKERNSCPRWNRVIKETLKDLQEERKTQLSEESTTSDCISRQAAIDALDGNIIVTSRESAQAVMDYIRGCADRIRSLPPAKPDLDSAYSEGYTQAEAKYRKMWDEMPKIIRCKDCKHWEKTCGDESWSVGDCDVFDEKLVMCKGFCAWAERRTDETTI